MEKLGGRKCWQSVLAVLMLWSFLELNMVIASVVSQSSGSSYFVFQQPEYPRDCKEVLNACSSTHNISGVYLIKPDGYSEPFEAYCDNDLENGGWTVLQRRLMESINFNRTWEDFRNGFGFPRSEVWLGNEKVAFLTNQKQYQLRLEFQNAAGQSYYVTYDNFRISDEWGQYALSSLGSYRGTPNSNIEWCPTNEIFTNETCERTCQDPETCVSSTSLAKPERCACVGEYMIHEGNCIPQKQCGCFAADKEGVLRNGESFINSDCTRRSNCSNNQVTLEENYQCSDDATCDERNGIRRCYCNDGYEGDGVECTREMIPKDCKDLLTDDTRDGVYTVYPDNWPNGIQVYCEMESNGGGWTVFQRRSSAAVPFYRGWSEYENGFGNPSEDHWLGNKYIHDITNQKTYELRIDLRNSGSTPYYALYSSFSISDNSDKYRLSIGSYSGDAGKDSMSFSNNKQFSTKDRDYDEWSSYDCAEVHRGAWWFAKEHRCRDHYSSSYCRSNCPTYSYYCEFFPVASDDCVHCADAHLNAEYDGSTRGTNMFWEDISGDDCGLRFTEMKIRPV
ncbi:uncharacterized protein [Apostichopus japonicus]|uniref:uncharacterized protein n=1 Tax=Stichopus japonicus TaxID=307972 RepID=UPI003AB6C7A8